MSKYTASDMIDDLTEYGFGLYKEIPLSAFNNFGASLIVTTNAIANPTEELVSLIKQMIQEDKKIIFYCAHEGIAWLMHNMTLMNQVGFPDEYVKNNTLMLLAGINNNFDRKIIETKWKGEILVAPWIIRDMNIAYSAKDKFIPTDIKDIEKTFLTFNRRFKLHRTRLIAYLKEYGVLSNCFYSYYGDAVLHKNDFLQDGHFLKFVEQNGNLPDIEIIKKHIVDIGINVDLDSTFDVSGSWMYSHGKVDDYYKKSMIEIVTETWTRPVGDNTVSEKTFKPIINGKPFIIVGQPYQVESLRKMGFMTFGHLFDESYDSIEDEYERVIAVTKLAKEIDSWTYEKKEAFVKEANLICEYNFNHFKNRYTNILSQLQFGVDIEMHSLQPNIHLVCFGEGNSKQMGDSFVNNIINDQNLNYTSITRYTDEDVREFMIEQWGDEDYTKIRGYGYWAWKPYIIKQRLQQLNNGEILHYVDVDLYDRLETTSTKKIISAVLKQHVVTHTLPAEGFSEIHWNKQYFLNKVGVDMNFLKSGQTESGNICVLINCETRKLIDDWFNLMMHKFPSMVDDNNYGLQNHTEFREHRHDQSVWSFVYNKYVNKQPISTSIEDGIAKENYIKYAIVAVDNNPDFDGFWPYVRQAWHEFIGVTPVLCKIGDSHSVEYVDVGIEITVPQIPDIPTSLQAQLVRIWAWTIFQDDMAIISDIDMIPLSKEYFQNPIHDSEKIYNYSYESDMKIACCYVASKGRNIRKLIEIEDSWEEFCTRLSTQYNNNWFTDQFYLGNLVTSANESVIHLSRDFPNGRAVNRLDRDAWKELSETELASIYDVHFFRPLHSHIDKLRQIFDIIAGKIKEVQ